MSAPTTDALSPRETEIYEAIVRSGVQGLTLAEIVRQCGTPASEVLFSLRTNGRVANAGMTRMHDATNYNVWHEVGVAVEIVEAQAEQEAEQTADDLSDAK